MNEATYLRPRAANFVPLTPLSFLDRTADIYPDRVAVIDDARCFTWSEVRQRCLGLAAGLVRLGVKPGDVVSILAPNTAEMFEAHFAVAMAGAVLNTINIRLDVETVAYLFEHAETRVLMVDRQCAALAEAALKCTEAEAPTIIDLGGPGTALSNSVRHADLLNADTQNFVPLRPWDEWQTLCLNYTSGTSGKPKRAFFTTTAAPI